MGQQEQKALQAGQVPSQDSGKGTCLLSPSHPSLLTLRYGVTQHYAVVDTSEGQVFIAVFHDINSTHLYMSEEEGLNYTLSLNFIISPPEDEWINGYPGFDVHVVCI